MYTVHLNCIIPHHWHALVSQCLMAVDLLAAIPRDVSLIMDIIIVSEPMGVC